jgi:hypothetical protein
MRRFGLITLVAASLVVLIAGVALARPADARTQPAPVRLLAELTCVPSGGAEVKFTVRNLGNRTLTIDPDFHLVLDKVEPEGREFVGAVFVFPIPELAVIAPGSKSTFIVPIGTAEEGEPGADLSARRLLLEAEVFFEGRENPVRRLFSFVGCTAPS